MISKVFIPWLYAFKHYTKHKATLNITINVIMCMQIRRTKVPNGITIDLQYKLTTNSRVKMTTNKISIALSF